MTEFSTSPAAADRSDKEILRASDALKGGRIDQAERLLDRVLRRRPDSAMARNLRSLAFRQRQDAARARMHAEKAVALDPDNARFRGNLGTALMVEGDTDAAIAHFDHALTVAPDYVPARRNRGMLRAKLGALEQAAEDLTAAAQGEPAHGETWNALAYVLIELGKLDDALKVLRAAEQIGGQTSSWKYMWGRLMFRSGRITDADRAFTAALLEEPDKVDRYIALSVTKLLIGDVRAAERAARDCFQKFPTVDRVAGEPERRVLVLETFDEVHLRTLPQGPIPYGGMNFISCMAPGRFAFTHMIADYAEDLAGTVDLDRFDVVYNNCAVQEAFDLRGQPERMTRLVASLPLSVINTPAAVMDATRDRNAEKFAAAERFVFPRTLRFVHGIDLAATRARLLERLKLPLILRPLNTHVGAGARLVRTEREIDEALALQPYSDFYAIEYHDCQGEDGLFRRYRLACVDGQLMANSLQISQDWNVHGAGRETLGWFENGFDKEENAYYDAPEAVLGARPEDVFGEIVARTPLDIYGIDFAFGKDGRPVVFEVNAAMALALDTDFVKYPNRKPAADRFQDAVERLFIARSR